MMRLFGEVYILYRVYIQTHDPDYVGMFIGFCWVRAKKNTSTLGTQHTPMTTVGQVPTWNEWAETRSPASHMCELSRRVYPHESSLGL